MNKEEWECKREMAFKNIEDCFSSRRRQRKEMWKWYARNPGYGDNLLEMYDRSLKRALACAQDKHE